MMRRRGDAERTYLVIVGTALLAVGVAMIWFNRSTEYSALVVVGGGLLLMDPKHFLDMARVYFASRKAPPPDGGTVE